MDSLILILHHNKNKGNPNQWITVEITPRLSKIRLSLFLAEVSACEGKQMV